MNPITNAKNLNKLNEKELALGLTGSKTSWHNLYEESAWIFIGGLAYDLTEGDVITVFSQYGEIVNINMVRDKKTGKSKGYCFICYEDQRSTNLAVDNFNGIKLLNRIIRVDHVKDYRMPKEIGDEDELTQLIRQQGCGPEVQLQKQKQEASAEHTMNKKVKKEVKTEPLSDSDGDSRKLERSSRKRLQEVKREPLSEQEEEEQRHRKNRSKPKDHHSETRCDISLGSVKVKKEPIDRGYDKYDRKDNSHHSKEKGCDGTSSDYEDRRKQFSDRSRAEESSRDEQPNSSTNNKRTSRQKDRHIEKRSLWNDSDDESFDSRHKDANKHRSDRHEQPSGRGETSGRSYEKVRHSDRRETSDGFRQATVHQERDSSKKSKRDISPDELSRKRSHGGRSNDYRRSRSSSSDAGNRQKRRRN